MPFGLHMEIRPHSPHMRERWYWYGKHAGMELNGEFVKLFKCFDSSCFMLPGGTAYDVSRVFRETFDVELPTLSEKVLCYHFLDL